MKVAIIHRETLGICVIYEKNEDMEICLKQDFPEENHLYIEVSDDTNIKNIKINPDGTVTTDSSYLYDEIRQLRNRLLSACDWTQLSDSPLNTETKEKWSIYRQALRDFPSTILDPTNPTWPIPPSN